MKHLTDTQLAAELENRRNALHNICQRAPELRPALGQILGAIHEAALRLRQRAAAPYVHHEREVSLPAPQEPRKRGGRKEPEAVHGAE